VHGERFIDVRHVLPPQSNTHSALKVDLTTQQNEDATTGGIAQAEQQSLFWQVIAWSKDRQNLQNHDGRYQQGGGQAESPPPASKEEKSRSCQEHAQPQPPYKKRWNQGKRDDDSILRPMFKPCGETDCVTNPRRFSAPEILRLFLL
jgi:hypothetical protein